VICMISTLCMVPLVVVLRLHDTVLYTIHLPLGTKIHA
jgi:hypothetical protein